MFGILELKEQREQAKTTAAELVARADAEQRDMTEVEAKGFDENMAIVGKLDLDIARREALQAASQKTEKTEERKTAPQTPSPSFQRIDTPRPHIQLRSFKTQDDAHLMGQWLLASLFGKTDARTYINQRGLEVRASSEGSNAGGGYLVPVQLENAIIDNRAQHGVFRANSNPRPMASDTLQVPVKASGLTAYFVGENSEITESTAAWTQVQLVAKKIAALAKYSSELSDDAIIGMADSLAFDIGLAFATKEDQCGFIGDGTSTYGGMYGLVTWFEAHDASGEKGVVVAATNHDSYAEYDSADIGHTVASLPAQYHTGAKWYMSQQTWSAVFERLLIAAGGNTAGIIAGGMPKSYLGYPVVISDLLLASATPTTDHSNKSVCLFGNLPRTSLFGDRKGITIKLANERFVEYDQIGIVGTSRFDIANWNLGDTSAAGGMVSLQGE